MMAEEFPLSLGDVSPGEGFTRLVPRYPHPSGWAEGVHTGGPFIDPSGRWVWKPTDVRPWPNCEMRTRSLEVEALEAMTGEPGFPKNWSVVEQNGREWIVRPFSLVITSLDASSEQVEIVKQATEALNRKGWMLNDAIVTAVDPAGRLFVVDLSNAHPLQKGWEEQDRRAQMRRFYDWLEVGWPTAAERYRKEAHRRLADQTCELLGITEEDDEWELVHEHDSS